MPRVTKPLTNTEVANAKQLKEVIAIYKVKGGELSAVEEKQAYSRFE